MVTTGRIAVRSPRGRVRPLSRQRPVDHAIWRNVWLRANPALPSPERLPADFDRMWPSIGGPVSVATQCRYRMRRERQRFMIAGLSGVVAFAVVAGFAAMWLNVLQ